MTLHRDGPSVDSVYHQVLHETSCSAFMSETMSCSVTGDGVPPERGERLVLPEQMDQEACDRDVNARREDQPNVHRYLGELAARP